jgi:hypothetical protein
MNPQKKKRKKKRAERGEGNPDEQKIQEQVAQAWCFLQHKIV